MLASLRRFSPDDIGIPSIVAHELDYSAYRSERAALNVARVDALQCAVVDFDREDARISREVRATLAHARTQIGGYDVLIAGQARARDLGVITGNLSEFSRVRGLRSESWE